METDEEQKPQDVRWLQRLQNLDRAVALLREPLARGIDALSDLEKEGMIQRFEFTLELAWKTLKDYLEEQGMALEPATPKVVVKEAFAAGILDDGKLWIDMLDHRNLMAHTYDVAQFNKAVAGIRDRYQPAIEKLYAWLDAKRMEEDAPGSG